MSFDSVMFKVYLNDEIKCLADFGNYSGIGRLESVG